ncbi:hypothetical protein J1605_001944 [Eschrichtius robustus]|uniref:DNA-PKcs N-terminal domain-containing protein n=1 Tax=Eschrichtius robustus TaxID=9764 RepID=A0AB34I3G6_ESCRO|nr:hypothetical protein J1605_001944 [Eschrichtius robustus]
MNSSWRSVLNFEMNAAVSDKGRVIIFHLRIGHLVVDCEIGGSLQVRSTDVLVVFLAKVSVKMKQYKDELLASCLTFVLSLPHDIIELDVRAYVPALQMAFKLGLSYTPLAEVGLNALEEWSVYIGKHVIQPYYKDILPSLDGYLKTSALSGPMAGGAVMVMPMGLWLAGAALSSDCEWSSQ